jgi:hypothetical protein
VSPVETAVAASAPTLALPRKRERERTAFGARALDHKTPVPGARKDATSSSLRRSAIPLPLAGKDCALSVPSPLVGEGQGGG